MIDTHVGLGTIIQLVVLCVGAVGMWFTFKERQRELGERFAKAETEREADHETNQERHEDNIERFNALERKIDRECVKHDDFRRFEDRSLLRFEKIEHAVNNSAAKTVGMMRDLFRDMLPARDRTDRADRTEKGER